MDRLADGGWQFRRPDGRLLAEVPAPAPVPDDPVADLHARHSADGLTIHARTACPAGIGDRLDLGWTLSVLYPRAT